MYSLVIFDLDGTILDTVLDLTDGVNFALSLFGYKNRTVEEITSFLGNGVWNLIKLSLPQNTKEDEIKKVYDGFHSYYKLHNRDKTKPYRGIVPLLDELKSMGIKLAVVSNKSHYAVKQLCDEFFPSYFDIVIGEREGIEKKPSPVSLYEVMKKLDASHENTLYVGDSEVDVYTAENAGVDLCLVSWGFRKKDYLSSLSDCKIVDSSKELEAFILNNDNI